MFFILPSWEGGGVSRFVSSRGGLEVAHEKLRRIRRLSKERWRWLSSLYVDRGFLGPEAAFSHGFTLDFVSNSTPRAEWSTAVVDSAIEPNIYVHWSSEHHTRQH